MTDTLHNDADRQAKRHTSGADEQIRAFVIEAAQLITDRHCEDVMAFDVRGMSDITDYILIATGTSDRQIKSVGSEVAVLAKQSDLEPFGREVDEPTNWLVLDLVDIVVHLFDPAARAHYDLEMLWGDAPKVQWKRATGE